MKRQQLNNNHLRYLVNVNDKDYNIISSFIYNIGENISFVRNKTKLNGMIIGRFQCIKL